MVTAPQSCSAQSPHLPLLCEHYGGSDPRMLSGSLTDAGADDTVTRKRGGLQAGHFYFLEGKVGG